MNFKSLRGMKDILPQGISSWQRIEEISREIFSVYGYDEIRTPLLEEAALFNRCLGQDSDIVQKQMLLLKKGDELIALRPEATASVVRAYLQHHIDRNGHLAKFYYIGPMFRGERPQRGRLRQFHHIGCEAIGSFDPRLDVEIICLSVHILEEAGLKGIELKINSLGCLKDRDLLKDRLKERLRAKVNLLCPDCQRRLQTNPLRILDCKNEACKQIVQNLNLREGYLCPDCQEHFGAVKEGLNSLDTDYRVSPYLVRGLDYYTRTVFEITHPQLGSQDALGAGGRYDYLVEDLGGPKMGAMGFALGVERVILAKGKRTPEDSTCKRASKQVYVATSGQKARKEGFILTHRLRRSGIASITDYQSRSLKAQMRQANRLRVRFVVLLGEEELKKGIFSLKDMLAGEQIEIEQKDFLKDIMERLK